MTSLDDILRKIERGERLTELELGQLRAAPASLRNAEALAHALLEREAPHEALALLESLCRTAPRHVGIRVARARALMLLERTADAEAALQEVLRLQPGDLDALKVLAVIALRRAEFARTRELVEEVLRKDPFDADAQMILAELDGADPVGGDGEVRPLAARGVALDLSTGGRPPPDVTAFAAALTAGLLRARAPFRRQGRSLLLKRRDGSVLRFELDALHQRVLDTPLDVAVPKLVSELEAQLETGEALLDLTKVRPLLRPASFSTTELDRLTRPHPAGFTIAYAIEADGYLRHVTAQAAREADLSLDDLDDAAWRALSPAPLEPISREGVTLWRLRGDETLDPSRLLLPAQHALIQEALGDPPWRARVTRTEGTLLARAATTPSSARAQEAMAALARDDGVLPMDLLLPLTP